MNKKMLIILLLLIMSFLLYGNEKNIQNKNTLIKPHEFKNPIKDANPLIKKCNTRLLNDDENKNEDVSNEYLKSSRGFLAMGIIGVIFTVSSLGFLVFGGLIYLLVYISKAINSGVFTWSGIPFAVAGLTLLVSLPLTIIGFIAFAVLRKKYKRSKNGSKISYNQYNRQIEYDLFYSIKI